MNPEGMSGLYGPDPLDLERAEAVIRRFSTVQCWTPANSSVTNQFLAVGYLIDPAMLVALANAFRVAKGINSDEP